MMTRFLLLLLSCSTLFAQRTPFKVNGTVVNNPDLTNSATITWTIVGAKIRGAAAGGGGGDTIWTNNAGLIELIGSTNVIFNPAVVDAADAVVLSIGSSNVLSTPGARLLALMNESTDALTILPSGAVRIGNAATSGYDDTPGILLNGNMIDDQASFEFRSDSLDANDFSRLQSGNGGTTTNANSTLILESGNADDYTYLRLKTGVADNQATSGLFMGGAGNYVYIRPWVADGLTPNILDTAAAHTSGNLLEVKNGGTNVITGTWDGVVNAVGGFGSTANDTAVTIASTGWTNTLGKNAQVMMDGVALVYKVADAAGTFWYTNGTALAGAEFTLQTGGKFIITSGTLTVGRAKAW